MTLNALNFIGVTALPEQATTASRAGGPPRISARAPRICWRSTRFSSTKLFPAIPESEVSADNVLVWLLGSAHEAERAGSSDRLGAPVSGRIGFVMPFIQHKPNLVASGDSRRCSSINRVTAPHGTEGK